MVWKIIGWNELRCYASTYRSCANVLIFITSLQGNHHFTEPTPPSGHPSLQVGRGGGGSLDNPIRKF